MNIKRVFESFDISPSKEEISEIKEAAKEVSDKLKEAVKKEKINADIFIGGSFAKGTLVKKDKHDIDIYIRFGQEYENLSNYLEKIIKRAFKDKTGVKRIHGSRDYFSVEWNNRIYFEIIPVLKIKHPRESRNVTDLSYFHVNYVRKKLKNGKIAENVRAAKSFLRAQRLYGAESYIQGFSGYAVECLIIYYKSFEKMLRELSKAKSRIVIDSEKKYKKKDDVLFSINESKLKSPIVLVDPTWKERNVLAALSENSFSKFQKAASEFLKKPSSSFFELKKVNIEELKSAARKDKSELVQTRIHTEKQPGDIAGTKLKKFSKFLIREMSRYFDILKEEFSYDDEQEADVYIVAKSKKEIVKIGPPVNMPEAVKKFKEKNRNIYEKNGYLHSKIKIDFTAKNFLINWIRKNKVKIKEMGIERVKVL